jgi:GNAT superfamily N-acetyltransferase
MKIEFDKVKTLAMKTDLFFHQLEASMDYIKDYILVKTKTRPEYFWGNYLITTKKIDSTETLQNILATYSEFFKSHNDFKTIAFDISDGDIGDETILSEQGFTIERNKLLSTSEVNPPPKFNEKFEFKQISITSEIEQLIEVHVSEDWYLPKEQEIPFLNDKFKSLNELEKRGIGKRFGAYIDGKLVADLGIYSEGTLGRFNDVATHKEYQRRGLCGSLVYKASQYAFEKMGIDLLTMQADENYHAAKIYESVGFKEIETIRSAQWIGDKFK